MEKKQHWETVYETKNPDQVSWTQAIPQTSLDFIFNSGLDKSAAIIDVGAGDSRLVDFLLDGGFTNLTVLDISAKALEKAQQRLGERAHLVKWIVSDITEFQPTEQYDLWHDRAAFHFLTEDAQVQKYVDIVGKSVRSHLLMATFSESGPIRCSGLEIRQYSPVKLGAVFASHFELIDSAEEEHITPFATKQHFTFCLMKKK